MIKLKKNVFIVSERSANVLACLDFLSSLSEHRKITLFCPSKININKAIFSQVDRKCCHKMSLLLQKYSYEDISIIFCDNAMSILTEKIIQTIGPHQKLLDIHRFCFLPIPSLQRSFYDYILHGIGEYSVVGFCKRFIKVIIRMFYRSSFAFASYEKDKAIYICPNYKVISAIKSRDILPHARNKLYSQQQICFLHGNESPSVFLSDQFSAAINAIGNYFDIFFKFHPRASHSCKCLIVDRFMHVSNVYFLDNNEFSIDEYSIGATIASSALHTYNFNHRISLSLLLSSLLVDSKSNKPDPYVYQKQLARFFKNYSTAFPADLKELKSITSTLRSNL